MKKSLLALAIGAAALPLVAQAAPEFYGNLGTSLTFQSLKSADVGTKYNTFTGASHGSGWTLSNNENPAGMYNFPGDNSLSWVGIRGELPLTSQNLKAIYQVEESLDLTGTNKSAPFTTRNTFVGLAGDNWGKFFVGNYDSVIMQSEGSVDEFNHTVADMSLYIAGQNRYQRTLNYASPDWSGLSFHVQTLTGSSSGVVIVDATGNTLKAENGLANGYGASLNFKQDTFWANLAYEKHAENEYNTNAYLYRGTSFDDTCFEGSCSNPVDTGISTLRLTAGVNIGNINLAALVQQRNADKNKDNGDEYHSRNDYMVSGSFAVTNQVKLKAQFAQAGGYFLNKGNDQKIQDWTLGADYMLGKNATTYILYSNNSIKDKVVTFEDKSQYNIVAVGLNYQF